MWGLSGLQGCMELGGFELKVEATRRLKACAQKS